MLHEYILHKKYTKGGEEKMKNKFLVTMLALALVIGFCSVAFAGANQTISVVANVPTVASAFNVTVNQITPGPCGGTDTWGERGDIPIDFGTLTFDNEWSVFRADYYYAVDVGVVDNTGTNWRVTHTRQSVKKDATNNLDNNINVTFAKVTGSGTNTAEDNLSKYSFANSNNIGYYKNNLVRSGVQGWLRIYYGIGTGNTGTGGCTADNPGVSPIGVDKPAGSYSGSVTLTLTP